MKLLITGADRPLGQRIIDHLRADHQLILTGEADSLPTPYADLSYHPADLRVPKAVTPLVQGIEAIIHLAVLDPVPLSGPTAEQDRLDIAARGTYVLLNEARIAKVDRLILASTLAMLAAYPANYVIAESWQPEPAPQAEALAPYLSEITCREFARQGGIRTISLRFGPFDAPDGTPMVDALQAISGALTLPFQEIGYRAELFHICRSTRFPMRAGQDKLGLKLEGGT